MFSEEQLRARYVVQHQDRNAWTLHPSGCVTRTCTTCGAQYQGECIACKYPDEALEELALEEKPSLFGRLANFLRTPL